MEFEREGFRWREKGRGGQSSPSASAKKKKKKARDGRKAFAGHPSSFLRPQKERKAPRFSAVCVFFLISLPERIERISVLMLCNVIGVDLRRGRGRV